ncbi:MAG: polysaccharide lyase 6 family protein [bacterium]
MKLIKKSWFIVLSLLVFLSGCTTIFPGLSDVSKVTLEDQTFIYDGLEKKLEASNVSSGIEVLYENNVHTTVGEYDVVAKLYVEDILQKELDATMTIVPATFNNEDITFSDKEVSYDGSVHALTIEGELPSGTEVTYINNNQTEVGEYTVTAKITHIDGYYEELELTAKLIITGVVDTSSVTFDSKTFLYDGTIKYVSVRNLPSNIKVVYENNNQTEAGVYSVNALLYSTNDLLVRTMTTSLTIVKNDKNVLNDLNNSENYFDLETTSPSWSLGNGVSTTVAGDDVIEVTAGTSAGSNRYNTDEYTGLIKVSFSYYADISSTVAGGVKLYTNNNGTTTEALRIKIDSGSIKFSTSGTLSSNNLGSISYSTIGSVVLGQWNTFDIVLYNTNNETNADVYLNDAKLNSNSLSTPYQIQNINGINFFTDSNKTGSYLIKDVSISSIVFDDLGNLENGGTTEEDEDLNEGNVVVVSTVAEIKSAIPNLNPGETLIIEDGTYNNFGYFKINGLSATADNEIIIRARNIGGAIFTGTCSFQIFSEYITISGLTFKDGQAYTQGVIGDLADVDDQKASYVFELSGNHQRISNVTIDSFDDMYVKTTYITVTNEALFAEIDNNNFLNKSSAGVLLLVERDTAGKEDGMMYTHIHHNYFYNYTNPAPNTIVNGLEAMRLGSSSVSTWYTCALIEYNVFEDISTEPELISVKSCGNVIRGNVVINCDSAITLRHGTENIVDSNVVLNDGISDGNGIRSFDAHHVITNNYISGVTSTSEYDGGIILHNGTEGASASGAWQSYEVLISNNTIVNSVENIGLGDNKYNVRPEDIILKNNFVYSKNDYPLRLVSSVSSQYGLATATFENEWYYSSKSTWYTNVSTSVFDPTGITGVNYNSSFDSYVTQVNGYYYHSQAGATNLMFMVGTDVGANGYTERSSLTHEEYSKNFAEWPFAKSSGWIFG